MLCGGFVLRGRSQEPIRAQSCFMFNGQQPGGVIHGGSPCQWTISFEFPSQRSLSDLFFLSFSCLSFCLNGGPLGGFWSLLGPWHLQTQCIPLAHWAVHVIGPDNCPPRHNNTASSPPKDKGSFKWQVPQSACWWARGIYPSAAKGSSQAENAP